MTEREFYEKLKAFFSDAEIMRLEAHALETAAAFEEENPGETGPAWRAANVARWTAADDLTELTWEEIEQITETKIDENRRAAFEKQVDNEW